MYPYKKKPIFVPNMNLDSILNIVLKGIIIGIVVSAPLGPVGVLCIQRTLNKGRWYGFITGLGASVSDIAYAALTAFGMSFIVGFIDKNLFYLQLFGSILLLIFGIYTFKSNPAKSLRTPNFVRDSYVRNFITAFLVTLSNPLIIFLFITLFARFSFIRLDMTSFEVLIGFLSIAAGALLWWLFLTYVVHRVSICFNPRGIWVINRIIGAIVAIVAVVGIVLTLRGSSLY